MPVQKLSLQAGRLDLYILTNTESGRGSSLPLLEVDTAGDGAYVVVTRPTDSAGIVIPTLSVFVSGHRFKDPISGADSQLPALGDSASKLGRYQLPYTILCELTDLNIWATSLEGIRAPLLTIAAGNDNGNHPVYVYVGKKER